MTPQKRDYWTLLLNHFKLATVLNSRSSNHACLDSLTVFTINIIMNVQITKLPKAQFRKSFLSLRFLLSPNTSLWTSNNLLPGSQLHPLERTLKTIIKYQNINLTLFGPFEERKKRHIWTGHKWWNCFIGKLGKYLFLPHIKKTLNRSKYMMIDAYV